MKLIRSRHFRLIAPVGVAFGAYRFWRRSATSDPGAIDQSQQADRPSSRQVAERVAAATAPSEEIVPADLTSPGTVSDPQLEKRRAREAVARERESRESSMTKFDELRLEQESERHEHAAAVADLARPDQSS